MCDCAMTDLLTIKLGSHFCMPHAIRCCFNIIAVPVASLVNIRSTRARKKATLFSIDTRKNLIPRNVVTLSHPREDHANISVCVHRLYVEVFVFFFVVRRFVVYLRDGFVSQVFLFSCNANY